MTTCVKKKKPLPYKNVNKSYALVFVWTLVMPLLDTGRGPQAPMNPSGYKAMPCMTLPCRIQSIAESFGMNGPSVGLDLRDNQKGEVHVLAKSASYWPSEQTSTRSRKSENLSEQHAELVPPH